MEETTLHPDYVKGFNEGYTISRDLPDLGQKLAAVSRESLRGSGFQDGRKQFLFEQSKDRTPSRQQSPDKSWNREVDPER